MVSMRAKSRNQLLLGEPRFIVSAGWLPVREEPHDSSEESTRVALLTVLREVGKDRS
jgi:hypothetical protein